MSERIEFSVLKGLIYSEDFLRKVIPFVKPEFFESASERVIFSEICRYVDSYNRCPTKETLLIDINNNSKLGQEEYDEVVQHLNEYSECKDDKIEVDWLVARTEQFCQERALYLAIMDSIGIIEGGDKKETRDKGAIPDILKDALAISFDNSVGHDFLDDSDTRFDFYHTVESRTEFDLEYFNKITKGGLPNKTLNVILAGTGCGKSLFMCHHASSILSQGKNVLYITMEMAEERIAERIDANLLDVSMNDLSLIPKESYVKKMDRLKRLTKGKLIVKEYPTASANVNHFRALLNELYLKKSFKPDILFVDYLNICSSARVKAGGSVNSYTLVKSIAEEIRGLAMEFNIPVVTATQTTRSGYGSSDVELTDTSESFGLPATADLMFALINTEELEGLNQLVVKQLKNRYNDLSENKRFIIGIDRSKMRLYDVSDKAQTLLEDDNWMSTKPTFGPGSKKKKQEDDTPVFDRGTDNRMTNKRDFGGFSY